MISREIIKRIEALEARYKNKNNPFLVFREYDHERKQWHFTMNYEKPFHQEEVWLDDPKEFHPPNSDGEVLMISIDYGLEDSAEGVKIEHETKRSEKNL